MRLIRRFTGPNEREGTYSANNPAVMKAIVKRKIKFGIRFLMLKAFLDILFPPRCHACKTFIPAAGAVHLCPACLEACSLISSPLCKTCGIPFQTAGGADHLCGSCISEPPRFTAARAAALFS